MNRLLTPDESLEFQVMHPESLAATYPNIQLYDDYIFGCVLVYPKTDGNILYVQTDQIANCEISDPSTFSYVAGEVLKSIGQSVTGLGSGIEASLKYIAIALLILAGLYAFGAFKK